MEENYYGAVIRFDPIKGWGFIRDLKGKEFFLHQSNIAMPGFRILEVGDQIRFQIIPSDRHPGKFNAVNVEKI